MYIYWEKSQFSVHAWFGQPLSKKSLILLFQDGVF
jgi:hypothetical protein